MQVTLLCKLGMTKVELRRLAAGHAHFFSFTARATRAKLMLLRTEACSPAALAWIHICPCHGVRLVNAVSSFQLLLADKWPHLQSVRDLGLRLAHCRTGRVCVCARVCVYQRRAELRSSLLPW